jgi:H/ACA ribonucleoprotein complex non-core subunit NAF1
VNVDGDDDEEEDGGPNAGTGPHLHTKHEIVEADIAVPDIDKVGPDEHLEKVGDIMSIIGQVVIVRGLQSNNMARGSQRALDSDTLLVFNDRTVMGYVRDFLRFSISFR